MVRAFRAFSLAELQITLFLILLVLAMLAGLGHEYAAVARFSSGHEQTLRAATVALDTLGRDLRGAASLSVPSSTGSVSATLSFQGVNPNAPRLNPPVDPPLTPDVDLNAAANMLAIDYRTVGEDLVRRVSQVGGAVLSEQNVAEGIYGFSCELRPDQTVLVALTVHQQAQRYRRLSTVVLLRAHS